MTIATKGLMKIAYKAQSAKGTAASGAGATGLEVTPSQGLSKQVAQIESQIIQAHLMKRKPRHGSITAAAQYETELMVGALDGVFGAVLGASAATASFSKSNTEFTNCTISGTGTVVTMGGGSLYTEGIRAGMMGKFTNMSVAGNNGVWFPITSVTSATVFGVPTGFLADNASDAAFTLTIAKSYTTPDPYVKTYHTVEEYLGSVVDYSKRGTDMLFHELNFNVQPDAPVGVGFALTGLDMNMLSAGSAPVFTSPTYTNARPLVLLDGSVHVNGTSYGSKITGATFGLSGPASIPRVVASRTGPDVILGAFGLTGQVQVLVEDDADFLLFDNETKVSVMLRFSERESDPKDFVSVWMGDLSWGGFVTSVGGDDALIATIPVFGGIDETGSGYNETSMLISTSAA